MSSKRPSINDFKWDVLYSKSDGKHSLTVLVAVGEPWTYFRVQESRYGKKAPQKIFYGETAHMDVERYVHDQAMEYWDFNVEECNWQKQLQLIEAFSRVGMKNVPMSMTPGVAS